MINRVVLVGRITKDPELRTANETKVVRFSIAVGRIKKDEVDFFDVVAFNRTAEFVSDYAKKGNLVAIEGRLRQNDYVKSDGSKARSVEISADNVQLLEKKPVENTVVEHESSNEVEPTVDSDDLPF
jgi:single-strand DNA-binding protein